MVDFWYLPPELNSDNNYKYIIDIIDYFTKFINSFLLNTKEEYEIYPLIKIFMISYGYPKYLIKDNGT